MKTDGFSLNHVYYYGSIYYLFLHLDSALVNPCLPSLRRVYLYHKDTGFLHQIAIYWNFLGTRIVLQSTEKWVIARDVPDLIASLWVEFMIAAHRLSFGKKWENLLLEKRNRQPNRKGVVFLEIWYYVVIGIRNACSKVLCSTYALWYLNYIYIYIYIEKTLLVWTIFWSFELLDRFQVNVFKSIIFTLTISFQ